MWQNLTFQLQNAYFLTRKKNMSPLFSVMFVCSLCRMNYLHPALFRARRMAACELREREKECSAAQSKAEGSTLHNYLAPQVQRSLQLSREPIITKVVHNGDTLSTRARALRSCCCRIVSYRDMAETRNILIRSHMMRFWWWDDTSSAWLRCESWVRLKTHKRDGCVSWVAGLDCANTQLSQS